MKDLNIEKLKQKDYFYDYIKEETDDIGENKLIKVVLHILLQLHKLEKLKLSVLYAHIGSQIQFNKKIKDYDKPIQLVGKFKGIKDNIYAEEQIWTFLNDNEKDLEDTFINKRPLFRDTLFNIAILIIGFLNNQKTKNTPKKDEFSKTKSLNNRNNQEPEEEDEINDTEKGIDTAIHEEHIKPDPKIENTKKNVPKVDNFITKTDDILNNDKKYNPAVIINWAMILIGGGIVVFGLSAFGVWKAITDLKSSVHNNYNIIIKQLGQIYTPPTEEEKDYGYLKTQFEKLSKVEVSPTKTKDSSLPKITDPDVSVSPESKKGILSLDEIAPTLKANLVVLNNKITELKKIGEKVEVKLDDAKIKEVFNSIVKDEKSEFGKAIIKINGTGDKKSVVTVDTTADKNKKELVDLVKNKDRLEKENKGLSDKILEVSTSVSNLKDEVKNKTKEIDKLEAKIKSIGDEKTGFKGLTGSFAILFTNSKDFPLNQSILSTAFTLIEKQPKDQKFGVYIATGNQIAANLDLRDNKVKSMNLISPTGSPTEMLSDAGQAFLDYAFDGKNPIPIPDRKAIIIATWSAEAPKFNSSGWKDISQVDAILIQPANVQQIRYAKSWLDFVNQKNGRLLLISGPDNFDAGSDNLKQLSKQISTLLNTKKD